MIVQRVLPSVSVIRDLMGKHVKRLNVLLGVLGMECA